MSIAIMVIGMLGILVLAKALSANAPMTLEIGDFNELPVAASSTIYEGSMVGLSSGYARALTAGDVFVGHSLHKKDNSAGSAGALTVRVRSGRYLAQVTVTSVAVTDLGKPVYASDDATCTLTPTAYSPVGRVVRYVAANTAIVEFRTGEWGVDEQLAYSSVAASAAITNTTGETAFDKSKTLDGTKLRPGDVIRVRAQGIVTAQNSTDTLTVKLYAGTEEICSTGAVDAATNDIFLIDATIVVRTIGASGTLVGAGLVALGVEGTVTAKPFKKAEATEDISGGVAIAAKATWSVANAGNSVRLDVLTVEVLKP